MKAKGILSQETPNMKGLQTPLQINAVLEMQTFLQTDSSSCDEDLFRFDACVLRVGLGRGPSCKLPLQNWPAYPDIQNRICKTHAEGYESFQQFQLSSKTCKVPCIQINTVFNYHTPQYLRAKHLQNVEQNSTILPHYLYLPSAIKLSKASPSYGFITFIAEVAGWYNLFLGGSLFALWVVLGTKFLRKLAKIWEKQYEWLALRWNILYILLSSGIIAYIFIDCITNLVLNPVGSNTLLTSSVVQGLSLSICLPQYTSVPSQNIVGGYMDKANSTEFWVYGNNLSNKIRDLSVITQSGDVLPIWNATQSTTATQAMDLFSIYNILSNDLAVDFCHTVELSKLALHMSGLRVRAVNDIELVIHLAGQLIASRTKYGVANKETTKGPLQGGNLVLYNSIVRLQFEETSFQNVSSHTCKNYNKTWTYDSCVMNHVASKLKGNKTLLLSLLLPSINTTVQHGVQRVILQSLYASLLSKNVETVCLPDCRSLIVTMRPEASPVKAQPTYGMLVSRNNSYVPLPPLLIEVNITMPDLRKLNQVIIYNINICSL
jgi:hypothetical protein